MLILFKKTQIIKLSVLIFILVSCATSLNGQIMLSREQRDSTRYAKNGYWFNPANYQFQVRYPKLQTIPPLSTGMNYETMLTYIYIDSLLRNTTPDMLYTSLIGRWIKEKKKNDTLVQAIKYYYKLVDYNPIIFNQYMSCMGKSYTLNLNFVKSKLVELLDKILLSTPLYNPLGDLNSADYILRVRVNYIDTLPRRQYRNKGVKDGEYTYRVTASVIDTLKGQVYQNEYVNPQKSKMKFDKTLTSLPQIAFTYATGPYSNEENSFKNHPSLIGADGNLSINSGQELLVCLSHYSYLLDCNYDYFSVLLLRALPIINGKVMDYSHIWSNNNELDYSDWKKIFFEKRELLLNGGY